MTSKYMTGKMKAVNPKGPRYAGYKCISGTTGKINCISGQKVCDVEEGTCVESDAGQWALGRRVLSPRYATPYRTAYAPEFDEDPDMGIFGRALNVARHKAMYDQDYDLLYSFTMDEIKSVMKARGLAIPLGNFETLRLTAVANGITGDVMMAYLSGSVAPVVRPQVGPPPIVPLPVPLVPTRVYTPFQAPTQQMAGLNLATRPLMLDATTQYSLPPPVPPRRSLRVSQGTQYEPQPLYVSRGTQMSNLPLILPRRRRSKSPPRRRVSPIRRTQSNYQQLVDQAVRRARSVSPPVEANVFGRRYSCTEISNAPNVRFQGESDTDRIRRLIG